MLVLDLTTSLHGEAPDGQHLLKNNTNDAYPSSHSNHVGNNISKIVTVRNSAVGGSVPWKSETIRRTSKNEKGSAVLWGETTTTQGKMEEPRQRDIDDAVQFGLNKMRELYYVREPTLFRMGLYLEEDHPNYILASFRKPTEKASKYARYGYAVLQAKVNLAERYPEAKTNEGATQLRSNVLLKECPLQGTPRCPANFKTYRTPDGTCNNLEHLWRGAAMLPMQRLLPPSYSDEIQNVRVSVIGGSLPSARDISTVIHRDQNKEMPSITLMFMQWGQFLDHDIVATVQARTFNRSVPRCCRKDGLGFLPQKFTHPECLPIPVAKDDWFLKQFGVRCLEFVRSAPTTRINCDLGWREQISQVTAYIDASNVYGNDADTADSLRLFRRGQLIYGRNQNNAPLQPPDPPNGELCRLGAITTDCFKSGDFRVGDQPALTAVHTIWVRYHNRLANRLNRLNAHWSDEKLYQETRRIIGALIQHITYTEFLPLLLGSEVMKLFELEVEQSAYYTGYSRHVNPAPANSFATAAFRFGHSLVPHSFIRTDHFHRTIQNNVPLHNEQENIENIWSLGSLDRLIMGLSSQPIQHRDEFITKELTNHLFQSNGFPFGIDLAATNIQRGRDHGLPGYTAWREPCRLSQLQNWTDLEKIMSSDAIQRFKSLYKDINDIDLFSAGLAEKPVRGGIVGPTFACIIAQQFSNLRKGDRFWYENGNSESSFTPAQLQQIKRTRLSHVLCRTTHEIETLQPFVFLSPDNDKNLRTMCRTENTKFDLTAWIETTKPKNILATSLRIKKNSSSQPEESRSNKASKIKQTSVRKRKTTKKPRLTTVTKRFENIVTPSSVGEVVSHTYYKPLKLTVTDIAGEPAPPSRPILHPNMHNGYGTAIRKPTMGYPAVDKYLISINQTIPPPNFYPQTVQSSPYHVNINIHFIPNQQFEYQIPKLSPPVRRNFTFDGFNFVTTRPQPENSFATNRPHVQGFDLQPPMESTNGDHIVFEAEPFAMSNHQKPGIKVHTRTTTAKPVIIPPYLYLNENEEELYNQHPPDKVKNDYSYDYDYDAQYKHKDPFVKISSVQGESFATPEQTKGSLYISAQQREGDLELPIETILDSPIMQVDVIPSEASGKWKIYNQNEEVHNFMSILDILPEDNTNISYAAELPYPLEIPVF